MPIADPNGRSPSLDPGYIFAPYIPKEKEPKAIDPNDFSLRKGIRSRHSVLFPPEPSAVDRLAALSDPDGEAGQLVKRWEEAKKEQAKRQEKWKVYKDPTYERGVPLVRPEFFKTVTVKDL